jgi:hypothetical protein
MVRAMARFVSPRNSPTRTPSLFVFERNKVIVERHDSDTVENMLSVPQDGIELLHLGPSA